MATNYSLSSLKEECKKLGITNSVEYKAQYKNHIGFPAHPERTFLREWISYNHFFDIPDFIEFTELKALIAPLKLKNSKEYKNFTRAQQDSTIPFDPATVYSQEWVNWFHFLGKSEPYSLNFITPQYSRWKELVEEFMKSAKGGSSKVSHLCRFIRLFIEAHDHSKSPEEFLRKKRLNLKPFRKELDAIKSDNTRRSIIIASSEFLDYILDTYLTIEDEETGEIVRVMDARNPLTLFLTDQSITSPQSSETTKPCLPYHFVKKAQQWIFPEKSKTFKSLKHLQRFDADWIKVDSTVIDKRDPDCVYKLINNQYYLWNPIDWVHTYALLKVPLRGRQIAYNDSGEADDEIADLDINGNIIWVKNTSPLAGQTSKQAFIKSYGSNEFGMYVTTNKTSNNGSGYSIPWIPDDLVYWLIKLRKWQQKYNPIQTPCQWSTCKRTNLNEMQLKAKGANCFLFRAFKDNEPKNPTSALTTRLAAALYYIQPTDLYLTKLKSVKSNLSHYRSQYTPHSMRVSLITAYIMEMGMPVEVVMKIVGHSSVVMSIYYCKVSSGEIKKKLEAGEKLALQEQAKSTQKIIEQNKIESIKNKLVSSNSDLLQSLNNSVPSGNYVFRDYGICPYAASRCSDGGELIGGTKINEQTPSGYLGSQNCLRCRHFITGPAFLGGLLSLTNEILLQSNLQSDVCGDLQESINSLENKINQIEKLEYIATAKGEAFENKDLPIFEAELRREESEYESAAKKLDMFLCDLQAAYSLVRQSQIAANSQTSKEQENEVSLITSNTSEIILEIEEVNRLEQLQEICENAVIFRSASAKNAILPRTQLLDRMSMLNNLAPSLFLLSEAEQLRAGNEICNLLKNRLKTWNRVNEVVEGNIKIDELVGIERVEKSEIELISAPQALTFKT
ncbi:VPA1269 family protein [Marinomonas sp. S3726]|uniref:gamma-mobile-trio integrase GmtZ n=1 Tax=Marinomonas sp. S3726 TaxID=579484 RepID=UPI0005FA33FA|nr:VPA1269 family protein [Marinomonas sp. S3726]